MSVTKPLTLSLTFALGLGLTAYGSANENEKDVRPVEREGGQIVAQSHEAETAAAQSKDGRVQKKGNGKREAPRYKPPRVGRAWRTIGGATRGSETCRPVIAVLAPHNHSGLTTHEQPILYWYVSDTCPSAIEFTLIEADGIAPLVEISLTSPPRSGLQSLDLAQYGVRLEVGKLYVWSIAFVPDREHRSKDILAQAGIRRVKQAGDLSSQLARGAEEEAPLIYAEAGLWYDALATLSTLIEQNPSDAALRLQRAYLLEQVQLIDVAGHETAQAGANPG